MVSEDSVQANLSQDDSQPGPSGLNVAVAVLGSQPGASTETQLLSVASQGANPTSGKLLHKKNSSVGVGIFYAAAVFIRVLFIKNRLL